MSHRFLVNTTLQKANFSVSKKAGKQLFLLQNNKLQNDANENVTFTAFQKQAKKTAKLYKQTD